MLCPLSMRSVWAVTGTKSVPDFAVPDSVHHVKSTSPRRLLAEMREIKGCSAEDAAYLEVEIDRLTSTCERGKCDQPVDEVQAVN